MNLRMAQAGCWVAGWFLAGWLSSQVDPLRYEGGRSRDEQDRARRNRSALGVMLGEFRTSVSDLLFIKTERYMHGGVAYRHDAAEPAHEEHEFAAGMEGEPAHEDEHGHECGEDHDFVCGSQGAETVVPRAENDFRGWIGDLYREVKPWRDPSKPHLHTDGRELLPWFRIMTLNDPHYVQGYLAGGFWLQKQEGNAALEFIEEGLRHNPDAFQLYFSRGLLRMKQAQVPAAGPLGEAERLSLASAREDFLRAADMGLAQRPRDGQDDASSADWRAYQENDLQAACRMAILLSERMGDARTAERCRARFAVLGPLFPPE